MKKTNKAFTLVELIVVITILAILGTIAFLSLQGYSRDARNSKRTSELEMIEKSLEIFYTNKGFYPDANNGVNITYSGSIAWTQGTFGANQNQQLGSISDLPLDPLTLTEYAYSTTSLKNEYQLGAVYEGLITQNKNQEILNKTYAGNQDGIAKVIGNYNGSILSVYSGATTFILAVPTIINGDIGLTDLQTIIGSGKLVYNGGNTLPGNYTGTVFDTTKTNTYYKPTNNILTYSGTMDQLRTNETTRVQMLKNLQDAYSGTTVGQTDGNIKPIVETIINTSTPTQQAKDLGIGILTTNLKIKQTQINNSNPTIAPTPVTCNPGETGGETGTCKDPNISKVILLLHMDGASGSTTFTDSSLSGNTITTNGTAKLTSSGGRTYGLFNGRAGYLTTPALSLGSGDFTVEFWLYATGIVGDGKFPIFQFGNGYDGAGGYQLIWYERNPTAYGLLVTSGSPAIGNGPIFSSWHHVAIIKSSGNVKLSVDGVLSTGMGLIDLTTPQAFYVGTCNRTAPNRLLYIDELRVTKGLARYTTNFTPPALPFPNQ